MKKIIQREAIPKYGVIHKLQPSDRPFRKSFKNSYNQHCEIWVRTNAGATITEFNITEFVSDAFKKV